MKRWIDGMPGRDSSYATLVLTMWMHYKTRLAGAITANYKGKD